MRADPFEFLVGMVVTDGEGKAIARKPSVVPASPTQVEEAITAHMWMGSRDHRTLVALGSLLPAIDKVLEEHEPRLNELKFLALQSPFVPPGHEDIFARGLLAGLRNDFAEAAHYLVPQIENSIRYVLTQCGVIASGITSDLLQSNYLLNRLLCETPETEKIFGEDLVFDLRGLLIEKLGGNLRNNVAHGLVSFAEFSSPDYVYLWGLVLRLTVLPVLAFEASKHDKTKS